MNGLFKAAVAFLACIAAIALACFIMNDAPREEPQPTYTLQLDCTNAAQMHAYGFPTKTDVMQYHVNGSWGYYQDGILRSFHELPGYEDRWDDLYGIEDNPAFQR